MMSCCVNMISGVPEDMEMPDAPPPLQLIVLPAALEASALNPENVGLSPALAWEDRDVLESFEPTEAGSTGARGQAPSSGAQWTLMMAFYGAFQLIVQRLNGTFSEINNRTENNRQIAMIAHHYAQQALQTLGRVENMVGERFGRIEEQNGTQESKLEFLDNRLGVLANNLTAENQGSQSRLGALERAVSSLEQTNPRWSRLKRV